MLGESDAMSPDVSAALRRGGKVGQHLYEQLYQRWEVSMARASLCLLAWPRQAKCRNQDRLVGETIDLGEIEAGTFAGAGSGVPLACDWLRRRHHRLRPDPAPRHLRTSTAQAGQTSISAANITTPPFPRLPANISRIILHREHTVQRPYIS